MGIRLAGVLLVTLKQVFSLYDFKDIKENISFSVTRGRPTKGILLGFDDMLNNRIYFLHLWLCNENNIVS